MKFAVTGSIAFQVFAVSITCGQTPFLAGQTLPSPGEPKFVSIADFNADGAADLLTVRKSPVRIVTALGNGVGAFPAEIQTDLTFNPAASAVGDFNGAGDGKLDLLIIEAGTSTLIPGKVRRFFGTGTGSFPTQDVAAANFTSPTALTVSDFNRDGIPDFAVSSMGRITILLGTSGGSFNSFATIGFTTTVAALAAADLNSDGLPDLAAASSGFTGIITLLMSDGFGGLIPGGQIVMSGRQPKALALVDLNHDAIADLCSVNTDLNTVGSVSTVLNLGSAVFGTAQHLDVGMMPSDLTATDLTGDSNPELLVTDLFLSQIALVQTNGAGAPASFVVIPTADDSVSIASGDVNQDGHPDVVVSNQGAGDLTLLLNATGPFTGLTKFGTGTSGCRGTLGHSGNGVPIVGNAQFSVIATNAPTNSLGVWIATDILDGLGSDPFFIGILLHAGLGGPGLLLAADFRTDAGGTGFVPVPIPNNPALAGFTLASCGVFVESALQAHACSPAVLHLETTRGLAIVIQ